MKNVFDFRFNIYVLGITISSIAERTITYFVNNYTILKFDPGGIGYHTMSLIILVALFLLSNVLFASGFNTPHFSAVLIT
ncbi:MAG: hypothetical protein FWD40_04620 [Treponema sp.]|nr:hypothetical protein [Treponema sp.]